MRTLPLLLAALLLSVPAAKSAVPTSVNGPSAVASDTQSSRHHMVRFTLINASMEPIQVRLGIERVVNLPGRGAVKVKLREGTKIIADKDTENYAAGTLLWVVANQGYNMTLTLGVKPENRSASSAPTQS